MSRSILEELDDGDEVEAERPKRSRRDGAADYRKLLEARRADLEQSIAKAFSAEVARVTVEIGQRAAVAVHRKDLGLVHDPVLLVKLHGGPHGFASLEFAITASDDEISAAIERTVAARQL